MTRDIFTRKAPELAKSHKKRRGEMPSWWIIVLRWKLGCVPISIHEGLPFQLP